MRIAVTGAGGFIGANLVRLLLRDGHDVVAILRARSSRVRLAGIEPVTFAEADVCDAAALAVALRRHQPEVVYHLASSTWNPAAQPSDHETTIVRGMESLLAACAQTPPRRLIVTGSAAEYGSGVGFDEHSPCRPDTALGAAKAAACRLATLIAPSQGIECVWLRLFTPYGPFEAPSRLVPSAIRAALDQRSFVLRAPQEERDFLAVSDAAAAMARAAWVPLPNPAILNLCSGQPTRVSDLVNLVFACVGARADYRIQPTAGLRSGETLARSSGSNRRAADWLGYSPRLDLRAGIEEAIAWWKEHTS
ncbi:MAG: NAD(P)-dependent oxidoreductase [Acidobacteriota bacterium]